MVTFSAVVQASTATDTRVTVEPVGAIPGTPGVIGTETVDGYSNDDINASFIIRANAGSTLGFKIICNAAIEITQCTVSTALIAQ